MISEIGLIHHKIKAFPHTQGLGCSMFKSIANLHLSMLALLIKHTKKAPMHRCF